MTLIPVAILLIVGLVSVFYTRHTAERELSRLHEGILFQMEQSVEAFITELDATGIALSSSSDLLVEFREGLEQRSEDYRSHRTVVMIQGLLNPSVYARDPLHSVYVFFDDYPQAVFTSEFGVVSADAMPDTVWLDSYNAMDPTVDTTVERRVFRGLSGLAVADEDVITIYRRIFPLIRPSMGGAIVLNISVHALESFVGRRRTHPGQELLIYGPDGRHLFGTLPDRVIDYQISSRVSRSEWRYELYTPRSVFLAPAETMFRISVAIAVAACVFGVVIALILTLKHFAYVREALSIIDREDHGQELPDITAYSQKGFSYITYHLLRTVMRKKYLEVQLSEKALRERALELLFLRSQMNPHFLFNTLEVINWKCLDHTGGRPTEINDMISNLSAILKFALRTPSRFVSLGEEIENSRTYMVLQKHRYGEMLRDSWEIDSATLDAAVIPMLIQPLLENAICHGIRGLPEGGTVDISVRRDGGVIVLRIADSGRGVDALQLAELCERLDAHDGVFTEHVGLLNSYRRLKLAFPEHSSLAIHSEHDAGFVVEIRLPYRRYSSEASERRNADGEVP